MNPTVTGCTALPLDFHDYSQPPHNTPETARPACTDQLCITTRGWCHANSADWEKFGPCEHDGRYEVVMYSIGTHDWITMTCCEPCTATIRMRHKPADVHSVRSLRSHVSGGVV